MAEFSVTDAAFTGFRIVRERPLSALWWTLLQLVVSLGVTAFVTVSAGPTFTKAAEAGLQLNQNPAAMIARMEALAPTYAVLAIGGLVLQAVLSAAMNRAVMRPAQSRFGYLRLAGDELRQLGLFALMAVLAILLYLGVVIVAGIIFALLGGGTGEAGMALALLIVLPIVVCVFVFAGVRFSLAAPMTFATGRINLFGSWTMTRGRFWPLFFAYLLAFVLSLIVSALTLAIAVFAEAILGGGFAALASGAEPDLTSLATAFTPASVLHMAITAVGSALGLSITMTPPATIYLALTRSGASRVFD